MEQLNKKIRINPMFFKEQGDSFHCGKCSLDFNSLYDFLSHKNSTHHNLFQNEINSSYLDNNSNRTLSDKQQFPLDSNTLESEMAADICDTNTNESICSICKRHFQEKLDLFLHIQSHSKEKPHQCIICGRIFSQKSNAKKHIESHKVWPNGVNKTIPYKAAGNRIGYMCPYCDIISPSYPKFKTHLKLHNHQKLYKCIQGKCSLMYDDFTHLASHVKNDHEIVEYRCYICSWISSSLENILEHQQTHTSALNRRSICKNIYQCADCRSEFKTPEKLNHHLETTDHVNQCEFCNKNFLTEKALRKHLIVHDKTSFLICDICKASFARKHHLVSHMATHLNNKHFSCTVCKIKFSRKDLLVRHAKIHSSDMRMQCPLGSRLGCKMEFTRSDKLKLHIKSHIRKLHKRKNSTLKATNLIETINSSSTMEIMVVSL